MLTGSAVAALALKHLSVQSQPQSAGMLQTYRPLGLSVGTTFAVRDPRAWLVPFEVKDKVPLGPANGQISHRAGPSSLCLFSDALGPHQPQEQISSVSAIATLSMSLGYSLSPARQGLRTPQPQCRGDDLEVSPCSGRRAWGGAALPHRE